MTHPPSIVCSLEIDAPPEEVWRVLTTPDLVREWAAAYGQGASIRTSWREGEPMAWKAGDGALRAKGAIAVLKPERLLKFEYEADPLAERRSFSDTFEIEPEGRTTRFRLTTGPLNRTSLAALRGPTEQAAREIKSLAEESAQIRRRR